LALSTPAVATVSDRQVPMRKDLSERALGALLLAPAALLLLVIVVYPIGTLFWNSLHGVDNANVAAGEQFVGLRNYVTAFEDDRFWASTWHTILFIVITVPGSLVVGLGLALLANMPFKVKWPVRLGLLLPWALPLVFAGLIFRWFFEYRTGVVNDTLMRLGFEPLSWLSDPNLAFAAISIAIVWKSSSFMALMLLAGLQSIPKSLYEAAEVDGASKWQQFVEITLPMLRPAIFVALIFRTITAIQTFDIPYAMTGGGPGDSTETLAMYIHKTTLDFLDFGYGSALAALMFVLSMAATSGYLKYTRRSSGRSGDE
jgi:multiple sugar transport system permease protein